MPFFLGGFLQLIEGLERDRNRFTRRAEVVLGRILFARR
jgi:hypothetical protein